MNLFLSPQNLQFIFIPAPHRYDHFIDIISMQKRGYFQSQREICFAAVTSLNSELAPSEMVFIQVKFKLRSIASGNPVSSYILL